MAHALWVGVVGDRLGSQRPGFHFLFSHLLPATCTKLVPLAPRFDSSSPKRPHPGLVHRHTCTQTHTRSMHAQYTHTPVHILTHTHTHTLTQTHIYWPLPPSHTFPLQSPENDDDRKVRRREKNRVAAQRSRKKQTQKADRLHEVRVLGYQPPSSPFTVAPGPPAPSSDQNGL